MAQSEAVLTFIDRLGDVVTAEGTSLSALSAAVSKLSHADKVNFFVQLGAAVAGVAGDIIPLPGAGLPAIVFSVAAVATGLDVLSQDQNAAKTSAQAGSLTEHQRLAVQSDLLSIFGDITGAIAGLFNLAPITKVAAIPFTVDSLIMGGASIFLGLSDKESIDTINASFV